jgi:glutathione S-transferase
VIGKQDAIMPDVNRKYIRLYGHYMCPFVEKVRLVLAAKKIEYQVVQINLQRRTKWHYEINKGFVPMIELPSGDIISESLTIMEFLEKISDTH